MRTKNTFSISFWADLKNTKNDKALVYARVTVNSKRVNISLKRKVYINDWDSKKSKAKGTSPHARQTNLYLDQVHARLFQIFQDFKFKGEFITAQLVKAAYNGEANSDKTLLNIFSYHEIKIENRLAVGTIRNFEVSIGYVHRYLNNVLKTSDLYLKQLDYKFISDFETYLHNYYPKGHPKAMSHNTVMKHIQRLRKIITLAYHIEWIDKDPFIRWKPTYEKRERFFLSENELSNIESYYFPIDRLDRVRDLFVFSCYTGISYVDVIQLTPDNIVKDIDGHNWIYTKRQKTKTPVKIPILEKAEEIIHKYSDHPITQVSGTLLPVITNEKLNLYLKEVADACGISKNLTFHMARHTFATTVTLTNGVPIETVSKLLGHTKIGTTQIYARVIDRKISEDMNSLRNVLSAKKSKENIKKAQN